MGIRNSKLQESQTGAFPDEFESTLEKARLDPAFRAAYEDELERHHILDVLVGLRRTLKLSQTAVAARMGVTQPTVSGFETEDSDPRLSTLQRYARSVEARMRFVLTVPRDCDWIPGAATYFLVPPRTSTGAEVHEGELAEAWSAEKQTSCARWSVPA